MDEDGSERPYQMGSYGIGITRIMAAAAEQFHDDAGLIWPQGAGAVRGRSWSSPPDDHGASSPRPSGSTASCASAASTSCSTTARSAPG